MTEEHTLEDIAVYELILLGSLPKTSLEGLSRLRVDGKLARGDLPGGCFRGISRLGSRGGGSCPRSGETSISH